MRQWQPITINRCDIRFWLVRNTDARIDSPDWIAMKPRPHKTARTLPIFLAAAPEQYPTMLPKVNFAAWGLNLSSIWLIGSFSSFDVIVQRNVRRLKIYNSTVQLLVWWSRVPVDYNTTGYWLLAGSSCSLFERTKGRKRQKTLSQNQHKIEKLATNRRSQPPTPSSIINNSLRQFCFRWNHHRFA